MLLCNKPSFFYIVILHTSFALKNFVSSNNTGLFLLLRQGLLFRLFDNDAEYSPSLGGSNTFAFWSSAITSTVCAYYHIGKSNQDFSFELPLASGICLTITFTFVERQKNKTKQLSADFSTSFHGACCPDSCVTLFTCHTYRGSTLPSSHQYNLFFPSSAEVNLTSQLSC